MKNIFSFYLFYFTSFIFSQNLEELKFKNIGPTIMSGRVVDININEENPAEFYVAYASGGVWYTNNNGISFESITENAPTQNCGALDVDWKTGLIVLGTGEINSSRSSYSGIGVLTSKDKGKTWNNIGLSDSQHISKIWINPDNNNEIIVGVLGHLYTKNKERGIFKTYDFGKTWKNTLYINDRTGIVDIDLLPNNPKIMLATAWERERKAWNFNGNGINSGIYKSEDGGETWKKLTNYPTNKGTGRIGVSMYDEKVFYAIVDDQNLRPKSDEPKNAEIDVADYEPNVIGATIHKSIDGGITWTKTHKDYIDDCYYSYGYVFANIKVDPTNENKIYFTGVPLIYSGDGGKTFEAINKENVHADHHVIWVNPKNPNHLINGNDGGVNVSFDQGKNWLKCNNPSVGQFYAINVDDEKTYNVYGGLQDNGVWAGPNNYQVSTEWHQEGKYPYEFLMGGDGMQIQVDSRNKNIIYTGYQFGNYYRINREDNSRTYITPKISKDEKPLYRFNWQSPILLSAYNQDILYLCGQYVFRSMNKGKDWERISPDLTNGKVVGNVPYGTITAISESSFQFGQLLVGTDDGNVQLSKDGGANWIKISNNLPQKLWVSRVRNSNFKKERLYVTLSGFRNDDFTPYVYVSEDYGNNWKSIVNGLPNSPVNVILEDTKDENILYIGTDIGVYITFDKGKTWQDFSTELPSVAVHDLVIQKSAKDLVIGTHGRSIYKVSIKHLQHYNEIKEKKITILESNNVPFDKDWGEKRYTWTKANEPKTHFWFYTKKSEPVECLILTENDEEVYRKSFISLGGFNKLEYDFKGNEKIIEKLNKNQKLNSKYLPIGKYKIVIKTLDTSDSKAFEIFERKQNK